ncbi:MAG: hypothetical protein RMM58_06310 [Chloroflexota bacterium]|nr:hypothetical protein [Dehalococcoidia bacterium]MDW8253475.1 hypothetical protein [Chloroflexota bacterium]
MTANRIGEVLHATTTAFTAACDDLHRPPPFGSLVYASDGERDVLGLVYAQTTGSVDPGRPAIVRGRDLGSEEEVYRKHPQLGTLLRTDIQALVVGFIQDGRIRQHLPPQPPRVHAFLYQADDQLVGQFFHQLDFLSIVLGTATAAPVDELIAAAIRHALDRASEEKRRELAVRAGRELVVLLRGDPVRVGAVLRRMCG